MSGRELKRIHDSIEVILRVRLEIGIPDSFLTEDDLSINHRRYFPITATEVKANPAAIQMAAERGSMCLFWRGRRRRNYFQWSIEHSFAHHIRIKFARSARAVVRGEPCSEFDRAVEINAATSTRPKEEFYDSLDINEISRRLRMRLRKNLRFKSRHIAVRLFESNP